MLVRPNFKTLNFDIFYWNLLTYFPYSSWDSQYHKTPNPNRISCKCTIFWFNLYYNMCRTERKEKFEWLLQCVAHTSLKVRKKMKSAYFDLKSSRTWLYLYGNSRKVILTSRRIYDMNIHIHNTQGGGHTY